MCRFVKFANEEPAKNSIVEVNGKYFQGAKLSVSGLGPGLRLCAYMCVGGRGCMLIVQLAVFSYSGNQRSLLGRRSIKVRIISVCEEKVHPQHSLSWDSNSSSLRTIRQGLIKDPVWPVLSV